MISMKILSTAAALALVLPMAAPVASYAAQGQRVGRAGGAAFHPGGGGPRMGGAPRMGGGAPAARYGGGAPAAGFAATAPAARFNGGGVYRGQYAGGYRRDRDRGFIPGAAVAGAVIGGAIAANNGYGYYGGPGYYDAPAYYGDQYAYDDQYGDDGAVAVVPAPVTGDSEAYCAQRYRSYDPASGTYLGFDGQRHPCP